jgi:hypothetical protein
MAIVIVTTDDGREVGRFNVPVAYLGNSVWRNLLGRLEEPLGWLGRALSDARVIQAGGDPERPSEKAMRLAAEARDMAEAHAEGLHDDLPREGCPECEA